MTQPRPAPVRLLAIAGSLRRGSFNRRLLDAALQHAPPDVVVDAASLARIPPYDQDVEAAGLPPPVARLKDAIEAADALLVATPEYNAGIPGVLKNAIDWASRPAYRSPLVGKPVGLIAASPGRGGGRRALGHLREVLSSTLAEPLEQEVSVGSVHEKVRGDEVLDTGLWLELRQLVLALTEAARPADRPTERAVEAGA